LTVARLSRELRLWVSCLKRFDFLPAQTGRKM